MSNTNGQVSFVKSMNGILSFSTGSGTIIEGDSITTDIINCDTLNTINFNATNLNTNNIQGIAPADDITLYTNSTGNITIGSPNSLNYINGPLYVDTIFTSTTSANAFLFSTTTGDVTLGSSTIPLIGAYVCTQPTHLANKSYVDSKVAVDLLPLPNVWTGTSNTFNNIIYAPNIDFPSSASSGGWLWQNIPSFELIKIGSDSMTNAATFSCGMNNGQVNIGGGANRTANVVIANTSGFSGTLVMCDSNTFTGTVKIASTAGVGTNIVNIGSTSTTMSIKSKTLSLDATTKIDILKPLAPNYTSSYDAITGTPAGCIGQILAPTFGAVANMTTGTNYTMGTFTNLPVGVWMLYWNQVYFVASTNAVFGGITMNIGTTVNGIDIGQHFPETAAATQNVGLSKSYLYIQIYSNLLATTDVYLTTNCTFTGTLRASVSTIKFMKAVRIA